MLTTDTITVQQNNIAVKLPNPSFRERLDTLIAEPGSELNELLSSLGICDELDEQKSTYKTVIHGDLHTKNMMVMRDGEITFVDFEKGRIGLPQEDLAKYLGDRTVDLDMQEEMMLVNHYLRSAYCCQLRSSASNNQWIGRQIRTYHLAAIHKEFEGCRYTTETPDAYRSTHERLLKLDHHIRRIFQHTLQVPELAPFVEDIREAAYREFEKKIYYGTIPNTRLPIIDVEPIETDIEKPTPPYRTVRPVTIYVD